MIKYDSFTVSPNKIYVLVSILLRNYPYIFLIVCSACYRSLQKWTILLRFNRELQTGKWSIIFFDSIVRHQNIVAIHLSKRFFFFLTTFIWDVWNITAMYRVLDYILHSVSIWFVLNKCRDARTFSVIHIKIIYFWTEGTP